MRQKWMIERSIRTSAAVLLRGRRWCRWIDRSTWTLIERGLFAVSNFVLNITLARWLSAEAYGAFAVAFSIFLMMGAAHSSFLVGPLLVFGAGRYRNRFQTYLGLLIKGHLALSPLVSVCLALVGVGFLLWGSANIGTVLLALSVTGPFVLLLWLVRHSCYVHIQPKRAAAAGAVYMVLLLAGTYLLHRMTILSPATALFLMAAASIVVAIWLAIRQGAKPFAEPLRGDFAREVMLEHGRYARWTVLARLIDEGRRNFLFFVLPIWGGLEATGALRALMNLIMPIAFMQNSLGVITVPILARARGSGTLRDKVVLGIGMFMINSLAYGAILILLQETIVKLLYADRYDGYTHLVWLIALLPVVRSVSMVLDSTLRAVEQPKQVFWASLVGATCAATVGLGGVVVMGALGAVIGLLLSSCANMTLLLWFVRSLERSEGG